MSELSPCVLYIIIYNFPKTIAHFLLRIFKYPVDKIGPSYETLLPKICITAVITSIILLSLLFIINFSNQYIFILSIPVFLETCYLFISIYLNLSNCLLKGSIFLTSS